MRYALFILDPGNHFTIRRLASWQNFNKFNSKWFLILLTNPLQTSNAILSKLFILGTKLKPTFNDQSDNDLESQVKVKYFPKWVKNKTIGHLSDAILPTNFILGTKLHNPISCIQWTNDDDIDL